ncbi:hypothetical protein Bhyg_15775 [Pseudolycoriella hygida]|uniref:Insulin-like domain-containing protein n=1 Tax=Pseudolycoriella hygida TaxID=35572 RepID=A0A9Q0MN68_9DIPT|nr:hypothetical protein Bhyg_15775 [Pseudolycoriella hygida]
MASSKTMIFQMALLLQIIILISATDRRQKFCGQLLTDNLQRICDGKYATRSTLNKRTYSNEGEDIEYKTDDITYPSFAYQSVPFAYPYGSISALSPRIRRSLSFMRRGVVYECCLNPCTDAVLAQYCN